MIIELLIKELRRDEEVRYSPYADTRGIQTVGVGHNLQAKPLPKESYPMTDARVNQVLASDLSDVFHGLDLHLAWWRTLSEVRQRVIANMCFNLGIAGLLEFKNTLNFIKTTDYKAASFGMLQSAWAKQVHGRAERLAQAMKTDVMPA